MTKYTRHVIVPELPFQIYEAEDGNSVWVVIAQSDDEVKVILEEFALDSQPLKIVQIGTAIIGPSRIVV